MTDRDDEAIRYLERRGQPRLAYSVTPGRGPGQGPGTMFLGGFGSDMTGTKARAIEAASIGRGRAFLRFDYRGHGRSEGKFADAALSDWFADALAAFDALTAGPQILVGSSMGGWIALLLALARPDRVRGLIGVAAAPDFTARIVERDLNPEQRDILFRDGVLYRPSDYGDPMPITRRLIEDGERHTLLHAPIPFPGPVRLLHGQRDPDVPWETSLVLAGRLTGNDVRVTLIKDGDHRLSRPQDLALLIATIAELAA